jgi:putative hydrolase of the HAD superfamily
VSAVLFDFYGTLAYAESWGPSYGDVLAGHGITLEDDVRRQWVSDAFDGLDHGEHSVSREAYVAWEKQRLADMLADCGVGPDDAPRLVDDLWRAGKTWTLAAYPETRAVLGELRARGVTVAICSNWDWDLDRALRSAGIDDLVDVAVTSAQAGARKPHRRIFDATLAALGMQRPDGSLFVGDSWHADVEGPRALGMTAVHVRRADDGREAPEELPEGVHRVADLRGVLALL